MKTFFGLTNTEVEIMEIFWKASGPLSFREILEHVNTVLKKDWKKQTLNTYLSSLHKAGLIRIERSNYFYSYTAACTKDEYIQRWTQKLVEDSYGNSICNLVAAFTGGGRLTEEEAERLRKLI